LRQERRGARRLFWLYGVGRREGKTIERPEPQDSGGDEDRLREEMERRNWDSGQLNRRAGKRHPGAVDIWDTSTASTRIN